MCDCLEPIRHKCGAFMTYVGIMGVNDVYECSRCGGKLFKLCNLSHPTGGEVMKNEKTQH